MTLREKIGQTCQALASDVYRRSGGDIAGYLARYPVGSVFAGKEIIGGEDPDATAVRRALRHCQECSVIPLSVAGDIESGAGCAIHGMTEFPRLMSLGAAGSTDLAYEYGKWTALEARRVGFNWTFGPVADLSLNWLNPALGTRCLGDQPDDVIPLLDALIRGYQDHGLAATAKHFPGDGIDFRDQHLCVSINSLDEETWRSIYGRVFSSVIASGVQSIMAGHIALPWLDDCRGRGGRFIPATLSRPVLTTLLREEMGFQGVVVSDALIMAGFTPWASRRERTIAAFDAGIDVMLWPGEDYFDFMTEAIESGAITVGRLDESVRRILCFKQAQGLFRRAEEGDATPLAALPGARGFAHRLAAQGLTLVRNRVGLLPLSPRAVRRLFMLVSGANPRAVRQKVAPLVERLATRGIEVVVHVNGNCLDIVRMEEDGERFDAFLCLFDQQNHDLKNTMRPAGEMAECLWTLQNTETMEPIVVSLGGPYLLNDMPYADTLINAYSADEAVMDALDKALFGEVPFAGRLPVQVSGEWVSSQLCPLRYGSSSEKNSLHPFS